MPDNINFATIPLDMRTPGPRIEVDHSRAVSGVVGPQRKMLYIGNRLSSGTVGAGVLTRITSADEAAKAFGRGSVLHEMLVAARTANNYSDMWAIALDDLAAGVAATGTIAVTGTATEAATIALYINGTRLPIGVTVGDTASTIATAIAAAINTFAVGPVTATASAGNVIVTSRHKGLFGNDMDVRLNYYPGERLPAGTTLTVSGLSGGSGNPDVNAALAAINAEWFYDLVTPYTDSANIVALEGALAGRWAGTDMRTGHVFGAVKGSHATLTTFGAARNSVHSSFIGYKSAPNASYQWAAAWAAVCEFSGNIDPAQPLQNMVIPGILPPAQADQFTRLERELLLKDGISTFTVEQGGNVLTERVITTYQTNVYGIEDVSFLDLETKWTVDYMRYGWRARIALRFPRHKLADDGTAFAAGQLVATPSIIRAELLDVARQYELMGLLEDFTQFKRDLKVVRSLQDRNRVNAILPPNVVNQFRVFAAAVQFIL